MNEPVKILKNTAYLSIKMVITLFVSLYTTRLILDVLGVSDYGIYQLVIGIVALFGFLKDSLVQVTLRYLCYYKGKNDLAKQISVFNVSCILHLIIALFLVISLLFITDLLFGGFLNIPVERLTVSRFVYYLMIVTSVFTIISIPYDSILNANENMLYYSIVGVLEACLRLCLALYLYYVSIDKLFFYAIGLTIISMLSLFIRQIYCHTNYIECKYSIRSLDKSILAQMVSYAGWNLLTTISFLLTTNGTSIVLNKFFGTIVNAAQGIATQVNGALLQLSGNIMKAINPLLNISAGMEDSGKMLRLSYIGSKLSFLAFSLFCIPFIIETPFILQKWLKDIPEWTIIFCQILLFRTMFHQLFVFFGNSIYASGKIKEYCILKSMANVSAVLAMIIFFVLDCPPYYAHISLLLFFEILGGIIVLVFCKRKLELRISEYMDVLLTPCMSLLIIELVVCSLINLVLDMGIMRLITNIIVVLFITIVFSHKLILNIEERLIVKNLICSIIDKFQHNDSRTVR